MQHCCKFKPVDVYYLTDSELYTQRQLAVGFCPICGKAVAELYCIRFDGIKEKTTCSGIKANYLTEKYKAEILYSMQEVNYQNSKAKPFGWKYGINKSCVVNGKEQIKQYSADFYGNKELIKIL